MIAHPFEYYRPKTVQEAVWAYGEAAKNGTPQYYGGGTEIITMARMDSIRPTAVIDLKGIPELSVLKTDGGRLIAGGCVTLSALHETNAFPLLGATASRIADHTNQVRITLGGNLSGTIIYREAVLPLLLADATLVLCGPQGERRVPIAEGFQERLRRGQDEFLAQVAVEPKFLQAPWVHVKKVAVEKIGYPLVTVAAMKVDGQMRIAVSGYCEFPFRSAEMERTMNDTGLSARARAEQMAGQAPAGVLADLGAQADFRTKVFIDTVEDTINTLEGE
ncbi:FAD binding domain-containing protein [Beduinella massiliensis]|uniref:FAD binding domain-containing protein n=1 Tax=Beduinella massiliensis TaxID=1852363 RepID=UPI000C86791F